MRLDRARLGCFLFFAGLLLLAIFLAKDQSQSPDAGLFVAALLFVFLGVTLVRRHRKPPPPSERFQSVRKMFDKQQKK